ncbi:MAG: hypothetical protein AAF743_08910 [Planctomycetota bacterium]
MKEIAFNTSFESFKLRRPFIPFVVELVNGSTVEIRHPESLLIQGPVAVYFRPLDGGIHIFDAEGVAQIRDLQASDASTAA